MKICVVTPYFQENLDWLVQAHASVKSQTAEAWHILVCDGAEPAQIPDFHGTHVLLQRNYRDYGNTPRLIGCYNAITQGADAIAFLDADNWYYPDHLRSLSTLAANTQLDAVASARMLHRLDGTPMMKCPTVDWDELHRYQLHDGVSAGIQAPDRVGAAGPGHGGGDGSVPVAIAARLGRAHGVRGPAYGRLSHTSSNSLRTGA